MVGAAEVPARRKPRRTQMIAWEVFSPPLRMKITARIRSSSATETEIAIGSLLTATPTPWLSAASVARGERRAGERHGRRPGD
ncbi:hypothetical protein SF12_10490 [Streptomyces sp. MBRL 601]|nr:hypothetical protein SF12_10490 [Streptomyces sp. MBRL 601]